MPGQSSFIEMTKVELSERLQRLAVAAADLVMPGMVVGLGTGSTADAVTRELGRRVAGGLIFTAVPTSDRTEVLARELGIPLSRSTRSTASTSASTAPTRSIPRSTPSRVAAARSSARSSLPSRATITCS